MSARGPHSTLWALLVAFAAASPAGSATALNAASDPLDALMHELAAHPSGHVTFTEVQHLAVLDRPLESSGELLYQAPDRLEKRIEKPRPETLVLAHGVLIATRGKHTRTMELAAWPQVAPLLESLRATLTGDRPTLERIFSVELEGDAARWTLRLTPRDPEAARVLTRVIITGENASLRTVEVLQTDGDRSLLTIGAEVAP
ncbi:MAG TPA: LolA-related protein [Steroidobacteraceae bacterium]|nr:LolA-related protein [Steroidobacteraceae bacterium]